MMDIDNSFARKRIANCELATLWPEVWARLTVE